MAYSFLLFFVSYTSLVTTTRFPACMYTYASNLTAYASRSTPLLMLVARIHLHLSTHTCSFIERVWCSSLACEISTSVCAMEVVRSARTPHLISWSEVRGCDVHLIFTCTTDSWSRGGKKYITFASCDVLMCLLDSTFCFVCVFVCVEHAH